jgi:FHA domain
VRRVVDVAAWPLTMGRALDNTIVLDDAHVAPHHLRLALSGDGALSVRVGDSINGLRLDRHQLKAGDSMPVPAGPNLLQIGQTRLRLRRSGDVIAVETPLRAEARTSVTLICLVLLLVVWAAQHAIEMDPGSKFVDWAGLALGVPLGLGLWCVGWGIASKLFQHRFEFWLHVGIASRGLLVAVLTGIVLTLVSASLGLPALAHAQEIVVPLIIGWMIAAHAEQALPLSRRMVYGTVATLTIGIVAAGVVLNQHRNDRSFSELYMATLPPPVMRLSRGIEPQAFIAQAQKLRAPLDERVREARDEDEGGDDDSGE